MNSIEMLKFAFHSASSYPLNYVFALCGGVAGYGVVLFLKWSINKKWSGEKLYGLIAAAVCFLCTFCYLGMNNADSFILTRKAEVSRDLSAQPVWRNEALSKTWDQIATEENQKGIDSIEDGGTMLYINSSADAQIYAQETAQTLEEYLRDKLESTHHNTSFQSKEDVAITVMAISQNQEYLAASEETPVELPQDNRIATQILELRLDELFESIMDGVDSEKSMTIKTTIYVGVFGIFLMSLLACLGAWKDLVSTK